MTENSEMTSTSVPETAKQVEEIRRRWRWSEPTIWTDRMLTTLEEGIKGGKWYSLSDKAFSLASLYAAFRKVKANQGAAGIDRVTISCFEQHLDSELARLSRSLLDGSYRPQAVRRVWIPKPGSRERRPLGIPTVRDRVVQAALRAAMEPIFEHEFVDSSYGFRPGRSCSKALKQVQRTLKSGATHVLDADLKRFFDTIPHDVIMRGVEAKISDGKLLGVIWQFLKQGVMTYASELDESPEEGTPQGSVISPLLANIVLHELDRLALSEGYKLIRYADDFVVLCQSAAECESALDFVRTWTHSSGLELHPDKTRIVDFAQGETFVFLGYKFKGHRIYPSDKSMMKFRDKIRAHTSRNSGRSLMATIQKVNPVIRGWYSYFRLSGPTAFPPMDSFVRVRLRSILSARRGVKRVARGKDHQRWPNAYFEQRGLYSMVKAHAKTSILSEG